MLKLRDFILAAAVAAFLFATTMVGCGPFAKPAKTALDLTQTLCVLAHTMEESATIATLCAIDAVAVPEIEKILSAHQQASARELSARGPSSAAPSTSASAPPAAPSVSASAKPAAPTPAPSSAPTAPPPPPPPSAEAPKKKHK
jgi:hypothetical protein